VTAIVGLVHDRKVYIGGRSIPEHAGMVHINARAKVIQLNGMLIGTAGSPRYRQIIQHHMTGLRKPTPDESMLRYLAVEFIPALRQALRENGFSKTDAGQENSEYSAMLIGYQGQLFRIECDFSILQWERDFDAIGSANSIAFGAMAALSPRLAPEKRITRVLEIAAKFDPYVCPPFVIRNTGELS